MKPVPIIARTKRRRALSHAIRDIAGERQSAFVGTDLADRLRELAADHKQAVGDSDQAELLARVLPPSHLPPELVAVLCGMVPALLDEDNRLSSETGERA